jgi:hypothetical protein
MQDSLSSEFSPAYGDDTRAFDIALSNKPTSLNQDALRLEIDGKLYELDNKSLEAKYIYKAIISALQSDWYRAQSDKSTKTYKNALTTFLPWISKYTVDVENRSLILKDFESYRVNEVNVQPQSSGLTRIINLLNNGVDYDSDRGSIKYIKKLLRNTKISKPGDPQQDTLTGYFASMPWLREFIGEKNYLKLESPKLLMKSFSVVVATTLLFIIEQKKLAKEKLNDPSELIKRNVKQDRSRIQSFCHDLINKLSGFGSDFKPLNELTELLLLDFVSKDKLEDLIVRLKMSDGKKTLSTKYSGRSRKYLFLKPCIFHYDTWDSHSEIEQYLCAWLCAWQAVQPTDIGKLKRNNFVVNRNSHGKAISIQCVYYKSRGQRIHEPPILSATQIEGKALIAYLEELTENDSKLFLNNVVGIPHLIFSPHTLPGRISRLFQSELIMKEIDKNLQYAKGSAIFIKGYVAVALHHEESFDMWGYRQQANNNPVSVKAYRELVKRPLPILHFGLRSLKNSSIHARTDKYRDGDLANQNSHTSLTEKVSYLTDSNQEWVNQNGRITRLIMNDIGTYVYKPNLDAANEIAYEAKLRTRVINALSDGISDQNALVINTIGRIDMKKSVIEFPIIDYTDILVLDSIETVVTMLHYINEADRQCSQLINNAIDFFENTVLPNVEWMEHLLRNGKLSPQVVKDGKNEYEEIKEHLPKLFYNELHAGVGI